MKTQIDKLKDFNWNRSQYYFKVVPYTTGR